MDKQVKYLILILVVVFFGSFGYGYHNDIIQKNFLITLHADCDPQTEQCFVQRCDGQVATDSSSSEPCTPAFYKKISVNNKDIISCNTDMTCINEKCAALGDRCTNIFCSEDALDKKSGEACALPEDISPLKPSGDQAATDTTASVN